MSALHTSIRRLATSLAVMSLPLVSLAQDDSSDSSSAAAHPYTVEYLVSDASDPNLVNAWGVAFNPNGFVWVADNGTGLSTLYDGAGKAQSLVVSIPAAPGSDTPHGKPTGIVFNGSPGEFVVTQGSTAGQGIFMFAGEDGVISAWAPAVDATHAQIVIDQSKHQAIYKGLALGGDGSGHLLYATDFHNRRVDVFDGKFQPVRRPGAFFDRDIPAHYAPFGIQNINGNLYVSYARQDDEGEDDVAGAGFGFVDVFDPAGVLIQRLAARGALNAPWGIALAPRSFGGRGGAILVGNFGDGSINAYGIRSGKWLGTLKDANGENIHIDGLWGISFGNGVAAQPSDALFFAAGPGDEEHGAYGVVRAAAP